MPPGSSRKLLCPESGLRTQAVLSLGLDVEAFSWEPGFQKELGPQGSRRNWDYRGKGCPMLAWASERPVTVRSNPAQREQHRNTLAFPPTGESTGNVAERQGV